LILIDFIQNHKTSLVQVCNTSIRNGLDNTEEQNPRI